MYTAGIALSCIRPLLRFSLYTGGTNSKQLLPRRLLPVYAPDRSFSPYTPLTAKRLALTASSDYLLMG